MSILDALFDGSAENQMAKKLGISKQDVLDLFNEFDTVPFLEHCPSDLRLIDIHAIGWLGVHRQHRAAVFLGICELDALAVVVCLLTLRKQ